MAIELARLTAVFGNAKDRPAAMLELMADEWHNALKEFSFDLIHTAIGSMIANKKFWPVVSEVRSWCEGEVLALHLKHQEAELRADQEHQARNRAAWQGPFEEFCVGVMGFIRSDSSRDNDFRNAGVRAIYGEIGLAFDNDFATTRIAERYGSALDKHMGFHVPLRTSPNATATTRWIHPKWPTAA